MHVSNSPVPQGNANRRSDLSTCCISPWRPVQLTGNGLHDVWHVTFVLLGLLNAWGLDIFYAYSAIWILAFISKFARDRLMKRKKRELTRKAPVRTLRERFLLLEEEERATLNINVYNTSNTEDVLQWMVLTFGGTFMWVQTGLGLLYV